jgi:hypothetical protein
VCHVEIRRCGTAASKSFGERLVDRRAGARFRDDHIAQGEIDLRRNPDDGVDDRSLLKQGGSSAEADRRSAERGVPPVSFDARLNVVAPERKPVVRVRLHALVEVV